MKLSKSKLALAKVINENGGWPSDEANFAAQDKIDGESNDNTVSFYSGKVKPTRRADCSMWRCEDAGSHFMGYEKTIKRCKLLANWHQTCLSCEEYYQAYPKYDADGWIEWKGVAKSPVSKGVSVDVKMKNGTQHSGQLIDDECWGDHCGDASIIAYRLHKQEVKPELCESVARGIPDPVAYEKLSQDAVEAAKVALMSESIEDRVRKPTIEQLAQDYRNAKDYAERLQKEANDAAMAAKSKLRDIKSSMKELGFKIKYEKTERLFEFLVGDIVSWKIVPNKDFKVISVHHDETREVGDFEIEGENGGVFRCYSNEIKLIRRP